MKNLYICAGIVAVVISVVTVVEGVYLKDRWGEPGVEAAELGRRFAKVPKKIGNWVGVDMPVEKTVQERSGAVSFVNREYTNQVTDQTVTLWLIVGHARDIIRHTPDICYPSAGFRPQSSKLRHTVEYGDSKTADFFTSKYQKEDSAVRQSLRVFWAWNHPKKQMWEAPENKRRHFGMIQRALYKLYFTSPVTLDEETVEDNIAADFAEVMLPEIDAALYPEETGTAPSDGAPTAVAQEETATPATEEAKDSESANSEPSDSEE